MALILSSTTIDEPPSPSHSSTDLPAQKPDRSVLLDELKFNNNQITDLSNQLAKAEDSIGSQEALFSKQEQNIAANETRLENGEGKPEEREAAESAIQEARRVMGQAKTANSELKAVSNSAREKDWHAETAERGNRTANRELKTYLAARTSTVYEPWWK